ncbi:Gfo/Idh/MocA family protein [Novosphingobium gossypii]|uniref:Gfo/Idh/MocA family protein n=1 Tax=Novosphingobium gossypii TaxID=1604774 RepID=UPI003D1A6BCB
MKGEPQMELDLIERSAPTGTRKPRIGFLGTGWIGRHRMEAMLATGAVEAAVIADPSAECAEAAAALAPSAARVETLDRMLAQDIDAVVVATPSALHAEQAIAALQAGKAVFCQKPLGRDAGEVQSVIDAARAADRLLGVDLSYRHTQAMRHIRELVQSGALGEIFAVDVTFHNAYGPDKSWFYDPAQSGGGCVVDLGVHLVDLALWTLGFPEVADVDARLLSGGRPMAAGQVEDYATAQFRAGDAQVRLGCSWRLNAGRDAVIEAAFYGTAGGAALRNVGGSFYDFTADRFDGTAATRLADPPDEWGARSASVWARQLAQSPAFDPQAERFVCSAQVLDRIYGR